MGIWMFPIMTTVVKCLLTIKQSPPCTGFSPVKLHLGRTWRKVRNGVFPFRKPIPPVLWSSSWSCVFLTLYPTVRLLSLLTVGANLAGARYVIQRSHNIYLFVRIGSTSLRFCSKSCDLFDETVTATGRKVGRNFCEMRFSVIASQTFDETLSRSDIKQWHKYHM